MNFLHVKLWRMWWCNLCVSWYSTVCEMHVCKLYENHRFSCECTLCEKHWIECIRTHYYRSNDFLYNILATCTYTFIPFCCCMCCAVVCCGLDYIILFFFLLHFVLLFINYSEIAHTFYISFFKKHLICTSILIINAYKFSTHNFSSLIFYLIIDLS